MTDRTPVESCRRFDSDFSALCAITSLRGRQRSGDVRSSHRDFSHPHKESMNNYLNINSPLQLASFFLTAFCLSASVVSAIKGRQRVSWTLFCIGWLAVGFGSLQVIVIFFPRHDVMWNQSEGLFVQEMEVFLLTVSLGTLLTLPRCFLESVLRAPQGQKLHGWVVCVLIGGAFVVLELMRICMRALLDAPR